MLNALFFCKKHKQGNALTILKVFKRNTLILICLLISYRFNGRKFM